MKRLAPILTLILVPLLASCIEPEQPAEDPLAPYKPSLLPAFQGDIAALGDIPRYRIAVSLDAEALTLTGHQQVFYTNNEGDKLGEIYFRLYPSLPQFGGQMLLFRPLISSWIQILPHVKQISKMRYTILLIVSLLIQVI